MTTTTEFLPDFCEFCRLGSMPDAVATHIATTATGEEVPACADCEAHMDRKENPTTGQVAILGFRPIEEA